MYSTSTPRSGKMQLLPLVYVKVGPVCACPARAFGAKFYELGLRVSLTSKSYESYELVLCVSRTGCAGVVFPVPPPPGAV